MAIKKGEGGEEVNCLICGNKKKEEIIDIVYGKDTEGGIICICVPFSSTGRSDLCLCFDCVKPLHTMFDRMFREK